MRLPQRLADQANLDGRQMVLQIDAVLRQMALEKLEDLRRIQFGCHVGQLAHLIDAEFQIIECRVRLDGSEWASQRRRFACPCLDWSERRPHVAGALGAELLKFLLKKRWLTPDLDSRALTITSLGRRETRRHFGVGA